MHEKHIQSGLLLGGRILISAVFIFAGFGKISAYAATQAYMTSMGVPAELLPLVIALELGAGSALLLGFQVRVAALLLAGFSIVSAVLFHAEPGDQTQSILFMKNVAIAGGLLFMSAVGGGALSLQRNV